MNSRLGQSFRIPETLVALLEARAKASADSVAYIYLRDGRTEDARVSYGELDRRARALAATLQSRGILSGDRALLLFPAGLDVLIALFGCLYAGVIAVPAPAPEASRIARTLPRLRSIAEDAQASVLISCSPMLSAIHRDRAAQGSLRPMQNVDVTSLDESLAAAWRRPALSGDTLAYLQYTSGSTSTPKGACIAHAQLLSHLAAIADHRGGYPPASLTVSWMPYFHDYGLVDGMLLPLFTGTPCVLMSPYALIKQPANWLRAISRYRATHSHAPNFAYAHCARRIDTATLVDLDLRRWQYAGIGAEPVNPEVMAEFARKFAAAGFRYESFHPGYGLAEATLAVTQNTLGKSPRVGRFEAKALEQGRARVAGAAAATHETRQIVSCGRPLKDTIVIIVDPKTREPAPADTVGEIWISSPAVASGYWRREEASEETFRARTRTGEGSFLRSGDLGFLHDDELYVCGRLKDLIIIRGQNISPQDIEWTVQQAHSSLRPDTGAAFSVEVNGEERLVVVQEVHGRLMRELDERAVFDAIRSAVGDAHGLDLYAAVLLRPGAIPKTSSGKIQRSACRSLFLDGTLNAVGTWRRPADARQPDPAAPVTERPSTAAIRDFVTRYIAATIGQPVESIDASEPFARFGLDSVHAVALVGELESWLRCDLPATLAFDYPNANAIARYLSASERASPANRESTRAAEQPIAIVGIGCRFPCGINDPEHFWEALRAGFDSVREVPLQRWDSERWYAPESATPGKMNTRWGGFVDDVDAFDAGFFAIAPREARFIDPQQRMLLEVCWEALEHAGIAADRLAGSRTGVFIGICSNDYQRLQGSNASLQDGYAATGNALSIAANRISYTLDLVGPSWAVDTACSSSLVAVHQACRSLLAGEADMALAGGVNLVLDPVATVAFSQSRMMSPTGRCRTFSDDADGYVRAEGCGVVVLKRLADAERDGNRIVAVIRGSAVNQDGRSNGLTAPSGPSQKAVVRAALADAGVAPAEIGYVEAHGTGTPLGDPIELNALAEVLSEGRGSEKRCWVGSVKTNFGHLEGAAGIAGLIKAALCVERGEIPRNLHFRSLNPHIRIESSGLGIPTRTECWPRESVSRVAGVSSFGFGGTNAHVVVGNAPGTPVARHKIPRPWHLLTLSARNQHDLDRLISSYMKLLETLDDEAIADVCHTANVGRAAFPWRATATAADRGSMIAALGSALGRESVDEHGLHRGRVPDAPSAPLEFRFADGTLAPEDAKVLYRSSSVFRSAVDDLADSGAPELLAGAMQVVESGRLPDSGERHLALSVLFGCAIDALWQSWGVRPDAVSGEGSGLYVAACVAGVVTPLQAISLAVAKARDDGTDCVKHTEAVLEDLVLQAPRVDVAGVPGDVIVTSAFWRDFALGARGDARPSRQTEGATVVCVGAGLVDGSGGDRRQLEGAGDWRVLLNTLANVSHAGHSVDWAGFDQPYQCKTIDAPRYPFRRARYWFDKPSVIAKPERPRSDSLNLPVAILDTNGRRGRDLSVAVAAASSTGTASLAGLDARFDPDSTRSGGRHELRRSLSENELETLSDDALETLLRERLDQFDR